MEELNFKDLVGKTILWKFPAALQPGAKPLLQETKVVKLSPSGRYVLLENKVAQQWFEQDMINILEVLD